MRQRYVAVIDVGKTNAKLAMVDLTNLSEVAVITRPNRVLKGPPWPHFDVEGIWSFLQSGLRDFQSRYGIDVVSVTTHGACAALLDSNGRLAAPILDYEYDGPDDLREAYNALRPPFSETGSPRLPGGLNIGAQLHWQFSAFPHLKERTHQIVTYPQYWGHRLTGVAATDVTSLGCHTDLWDPQNQYFSGLLETLGIDGKVANPLRPNEILGTILPDLAAATGMSETTPVLCGIHDSNASLLPHLLQNEPPFSVVSTGTWVIAMSVGGHKMELDPTKDVLINVDALGHPVPSSRFMGGREFDLMTGGRLCETSEADLAQVLHSKTILLPAVVPGSGPFKGHTSRWVGREPERETAHRQIAVTLYLALVTAECLENTGHDGDIVVEGPFASNQVFLQMLSAVTKAKVLPSQGKTGTSHGAALLATDLRKTRPSHMDAVSPGGATLDPMQTYARAWRAAMSDQ